MYVNAEAILRLLTDINDLWNREGFESDDAETETAPGRGYRPVEWGRRLACCRADDA
jgi:hypothetical protein